MIHGLHSTRQSAPLRSRENIFEIKGFLTRLLGRIEPIDNFPLRYLSRILQQPLSLADDLGTDVGKARQFSYGKPLGYAPILQSVPIHNNLPNDEILLIKTPNNATA